MHALCLSIVLLSRGIPFLHGGCELLRSKFGISNSYKSGDEINMYRWSNKSLFINFFKYLSQIIKFRK